MGELTPYICVADSRAAIEWYREFLGAEVTVDPIVMDDGHVGHCELAVDGARRMMSDAYEGEQDRHEERVLGVFGAGDGLDVHRRTRGGGGPVEPDRRVEREGAGDGVAVVGGDAVGDRVVAAGCV